MKPVVPIHGVPGQNMKANPHSQKVTPQMQVSAIPSTRMLTARATRETGLQHHEADLHAEHQIRRDQRPYRVNRVDMRRRQWRRRISVSASGKYLWR